MRFITSAICALAASVTTVKALSNNTSQPLPPPTAGDGLPSNFGLLLFPEFQSLDVFGPLDALNLFSLARKLNLSIIAETMDPVSTQVRSAQINKFGSTFGESILPTHTFKNAPPLDVLLIPGGYGTDSPDIGPAIEFIKKTYPSLQYILTVCTGSQLLAQAGILDGRHATTNKQVYNRVIKHGPNVKWVPEARWVADGNIWTSSGVSAGIDLMFAFLDAVYGTVLSNQVSEGMEYVRNVDWRNDPFAHYIKDGAPMS
ncbi:DJ-1/PfpI family protein [Nannizzia gypsea CBS 118893]|uniref:DJ-1/PfpI family protein n=1 Tax=Arthroderma gypseum (strain ATCC MYA-4604 / CBS 118893) TaxID=535722 RepID=E4V5W3_ARTGP|nr:DJ-1/PfpI family protein [Nannizzia gypsea CBS 118893]EFR05488.1 DJ-1/PfpI family protein [Nannizzia gypsea CBS 118893]